MTDYLLGLSIGPVQGFIAAARRTRDLWFGSHLLSEVSKAAARAWQKREGRLVFPAPESSDDLEPNSRLDVGNKLMAIVNTDDPEGFLDVGKEGSRKRWQTLAEAARDKVKGGVRANIWDRQIGDVLELYGAWVPIGSGADGYSLARARLERLLGARKSTRDFQPAATGFRQEPEFGLPKSSLDAARETVLNEKLSSRFRRQLGLAPNEQVDCTGLVKRLGGDPEQFPPVTRIALEAWLDQGDAPDLQAFNDACEPLVHHRLITRVKPERFERLSYDGAFLFTSRIEAEARHLEQGEGDAKPLLNVLKRLRDDLHNKFGTPTPYFAILVADGDHIGAFIDEHDDEGAHINLTHALVSFADKARLVVEKHQGACVYAGGDDVLALLPIHRAVDCAVAIKNEFAGVVAPLVVDATNLPTLSIGLGLGHVLTPFNCLLDLGRRAEKLAKEGPEGTATEHKRNALAIVVGVRSGAEIAVRSRWVAPAGQPDIAQRLRIWTSYYRDERLSDKTPYDLRAAAVRVAWAEGPVVVQEASRVLNKKRSEAGTKELSSEVKVAITDAIKANGFETTIDELLVARWLSQEVKN